MGTFRIEIEATGGHGDLREVKDGEALTLEAYPEHSLDKLAFEVVDALKARGAQVSAATLTHWPGQPSEVVDDLLTKTRRGNF